MRRIIGILAIGALLVAATPAAFGGWAVITIESLPEYLEAGQPTTLTFMVRQHGQTPMADLSPTVSLQPRGAHFAFGRSTVTAMAAGAPGRYQATVTAPDTGAVRLTIDANWHAAEIALLPIPVVAEGRAPAPLAEPDRGRQLFVSKGCVTCHAKGDDREMLARHDLEIGPPLTGRQFPAEWLAGKLADPARYRPTPDAWGMPDLRLSAQEIAALASYVNRTQPVATARSSR
jgi:mono/diheme cytochrome c family protein